MTLQSLLAFPSSLGEQQQQPCFLTGSASGTKRSCLLLFLQQFLSVGCARVCVTLGTLLEGSSGTGEPRGEGSRKARGAEAGAEIPEGTARTAGAPGSSKRS